MKLWLAGAMFLLLVGTAFAGDLEIKQVLFDPEQSESGGEFVMLYNSGEAVNLSGYLLKTETSDTDVSFPGEILDSGGYYLVTDSNWDLAKDNETWPDADYKEDMTLKNSNDGVALMYNGSIVDAVGWGSSLEIEEGLYEGSPYGVVTPGMSLIRSQDSGDNSEDFFSSVPLFVFEEGADDEKVEISFEVSDSGPVIIDVIVDDDLNESGIQIFPKPGDVRVVNVDIIAEDEDLTTYFILDGEKYNDSFTMDYFQSSGNYTLQVFAVDPSNESASMNISFSYMELVSIGLDSESISLGAITKDEGVNIVGDLSWDTLDKPTVKNFGNVLIDVGLDGSDFVDGEKNIGIESMKFSLGENNGILSQDLQVVDLDLSGGDLIDLGFILTLPQGVEKGKYKGSVAVVGVAS